MFAHRDDIPFEVAEKIVKSLQELHPGMSVQFAGDVPENEIPPELKAKFLEFEEKMNKSLAEGTCMHCGKKIPGFPGSLGEDLPDGWGYVEAGPDLGFFVCDPCDENKNIFGGANIIRIDEE